MKITSKELAKIAGVNQSTVSRSLNGSSGVSEKTRKRILMLAKEYGFELNSHARSLKTSKAGTIGIIYPRHFIDFEKNLYLSAIHSELMKSFENEDVDLLVLSEYNGSNNVNNIIKTFRANKVDGFIFLKANISDETYDFLKLNDVPCVCLNKLKERNMDAFTLITVDNYFGGYEVGKLLAGKGHKQIMCITARDDASELEERTRGLYQSLNESELSDYNISYVEGDFTFESGYDALIKNKKMLNDITAIFAENDTMALGALKALHELGINVPGDISLVGYDDLELCSFFTPYITTVRNPRRKLAELVKKELLDELENKCSEKKHIIVKPNLIERESS